MNGENRKCNNRKFPLRPPPFTTMDNTTSFIVDNFNYQQINQYFNYDSVNIPQAAGSSNLNAFWKINKKKKSFYTGAKTYMKVSFNSSSGIIASPCEDDIAVVDAETGDVLSLLQASAKQISQQDKVSLYSSATALKKQKAAKSQSNADGNDNDAALSIPVSYQAKIGMDVFTAFDLHPKNGKEIVTVSRSMLIRVWDISDPTKPACKKTWAALHNTPISTCVYHPSGEYFATGSTDGTVKVWSTSGGFCTHNLSGHSAIITCIKFKPDPMRLLLAIGDNSGMISMWELKKKSETSNKFMKNHMTVVTSLAFSISGQQLISSSRDRVVNVWSLETYEILHTLPLLETIESIVALPQTYLGSFEKLDPLKSCIFCTAGSSGNVKVWRFEAASESKGKSATVSSCKCVYQQENENPDNVDSFVQILLHERKKELLSISTEGIFSLLSFPTLKPRKQIAGYDDDMLDICYLNPEKSSMLLATNSPIVRVLNINTFSCYLLVGHKDAVLGVSAFPRQGYKRIHLDSSEDYQESDEDEMFVSVSKDQTARVWIQYKPTKIEKNNDGEDDTSLSSVQHRCIYICKGHSEEITCVSSSNGTSGPLGSLFFVTGSSDRTIKIWSLADKKLRKKWKDAKNGVEQDLSSDDMQLSSQFTEIAHGKGVTSVGIAPYNDSIIASTSLDKTAKIWELASNRLVLKAVLKGHSRAVSSLSFSSKETKTIATGSSDKTIRIWNLSDYTCLRTLEGHGSAVMCVRFAPCFQSSSSQHTSKNQDQNAIISAASDGTMKVWDLKASQCVQTLASSNDNIETYFSKESGHDDRIWSFTISPDAEYMISVGSNSTMCIWKDCANDLSKELFVANRERLLNEELLNKAFRSGEMETAAVLALSLEKPLMMRQILESVRDQAAMKSQSPDDSLVKFVVDLIEDKKLKDGSRDVGRLISYAKEWNTTTRNSHLSQLVIRAVLTVYHQHQHSNDELATTVLTNKSELDELVTALIPYTERHLRRLDKLMRDSFLIDHALTCSQELSELS